MIYVYYDMNTKHKKTTYAELWDTSTDPWQLKARYVKGEEPAGFGLEAMVAAKYVVRFRTTLDRLKVTRVNTYTYQFTYPYEGAVMFGEYAWTGPQPLTDTELRIILVDNGVRADASEITILASSSETLER